VKTGKEQKDYFLAKGALRKTRESSKTTNAIGKREARPRSKQKGESAGDSIKLRLLTNVVEGLAYLERPSVRQTEHAAQLDERTRGWKEDGDILFTGLTKDINPLTGAIKSELRKKSPGAVSWQTPRQ